MCRQHRLDLLRGGRDADPRQQTLRATIEWSYNLLDEAERRLFRSLSVFAGGCTYEAAEAVCDADPDTLQSLLDKSLLRRRATDLGPRYWMLETMREYAAELEQEDPVSAHRAHAEWVAGEVASWVPRLTEYDQLEAFARLDAEVDNIRAAMDWGAGSADQEVPANLVSTATRYMWRRGHGAEMVERLERLARLRLDDAIRLPILGELGFLLGRQGRNEEAIRELRAALDIAVALDKPHERANLTYALAHALDDLGLADDARPLFETALKGFGAVGDDRGVALVQWGLATFETEPSRALDRLDQALAFHRGAHDTLGVAWIQAQRAPLLSKVGDPTAALESLAESLRTYSELGAAVGCADALFVFAELFSESQTDMAAAALSLLEVEFVSEVDRWHTERVERLRGTVAARERSVPIEPLRVLCEARAVVESALASRQASVSIH